MGGMEGNVEGGGNGEGWKNGNRGGTGMMIITLLCQIY